MGADKPTRRVFLWCPAATLQRLQRTKAIPYALRLAAKHHRNTELAIIMLKEHSFPVFVWRGAVFNPHFHLTPYAPTLNSEEVPE